MPPLPAHDRPTVVLADDHAIVRRGLRTVLELDGELDVVGEAEDVPGAVRKVRAYKPDVALIDISMPGGPSTNAIGVFREASPGTALVFLTMDDNPALAKAAMQAGADGFVLKDQADADLIEAVVAAAEGVKYLSPRLGARIAMMGATTPPDSLTEREIEVLQMIALGYTNAEIAETLYLSVRTVESHRTHIQHKIGKTTRAELVAYAHVHGLLERELVGG